MVNFMTCTKLIVGCIKSKVINTLYITNWKSIHKNAYVQNSDRQFSIRTFKVCLISVQISVGLYNQDINPKVQICCTSLPRRTEQF